MATRSRTSFQKRQKEIARMEKQRDKAARRAQRKLMPPEGGDVDEMLTDEMGQPLEAANTENTANIAVPLNTPSSLHE